MSDQVNKLIEGYKKDFFEKTGFHLFTTVEYNKTIPTFFLSIGKTVNIYAVILICCQYGKWSYHNIRRKMKPANLVMQRQLLAGILSNFGLSYRQIGDAIGYPEHTAVMHSVKKFQDYRDTDFEFKKLYEQLVKQIENNYYFYDSIDKNEFLNLLKLIPKDAK